ncbi:MAG: hypothetical protein M1813_007608 [Trichoglossum hirsutum]|nr:MAG: hypothetical protein M1813_007608 [Trichoglossum hirsutum]
MSEASITGGIDKGENMLRENDRNRLVNDILGAHLIDFGVLQEATVPKGSTVSKVEFGLRKNDVWLFRVLAFESLHGCSLWQD